MVQIPNKPAALRQVATHLAGHLHACADYDEAAGMRDDQLTDAEARRLDWAIEEISRRLYAMGGQAPQDTGQGTQE